MKLAEIAFFTDHVSPMTDFYGRLLGSEPVARSETMAIFFTNETKLFIHYKYAPKEGELPPEDHHAFIVEDVDMICEQLIAQGLTLEIPPREFYWGRSAYLRDPDGHQIEITQLEK
ncbi:MAG TPA: VOC family protein [Anaerolineales bacterium]|nr:VOC family protein [Anaerolineales bacterium]